MPPRIGHYHGHAASPQSVTAQAEVRWVACANRNPLHTFLHNSNSKGMGRAEQSRRERTGRVESGDQSTRGERSAERGANGESREWSVEHTGRAESGAQSRRGDGERRPEREGESRDRRPEQMGRAESGARSTWGEWRVERGADGESREQRPERTGRAETGARSTHGSTLAPMCTQTKIDYRMHIRTSTNVHSNQVEQLNAHRCHSKQDELPNAHQCQH